MSTQWSSNLVEYLVLVDMIITAGDRERRIEVIDSERAAGHIKSRSFCGSGDLPELERPAGQDESRIRVATAVNPTAPGSRIQYLLTGSM